MTALTGLALYALGAAIVAWGAYGLGRRADTARRSAAWDEGRAAGRAEMARECLDAGAEDPVDFGAPERIARIAKVAREDGYEAGRERGWREGHAAGRRDPERELAAQPDDPPRPGITCAGCWRCDCGAPPHREAGQRAVCDPLPADGGEPGMTFGQVCGMIERGAAPWPRAGAGA